MSIQRGLLLKSWAKWRWTCWIASQDISLMPDGLWEIGPKKENLHKHYCLPVPLLVWRLSLTHQHHAKLDYSSRGDTIPSLSQLLQPPWLDHKFFLSSVSVRYNDAPGDWPLDSPQGVGGQPCLSWVRAVEIGCRRASCWCGSRSRVVDSRTWPWPFPYCGVRPRAQKTKVSYREQGMSSYSLGLNWDMCPAQCWPPETEQVSRARLLLLTTDLRVKAAALIRGGILL